MPCPFCASTNRVGFPAEVNIHLAGLMNAGKPGVLVFPKLLVCLDCALPRSRHRLSSWRNSQKALRRLRTVCPTGRPIGFRLCRKDVTPCTQPHSFLNDVSIRTLTM
jgi:hypothetical protein